MEQNEEATKTNTEHPYNLFLLMTKTTVTLGF
jgi:hypothetical protein